MPSKKWDTSWQNLSSPDMQTSLIKTQQMVYKRLTQNQIVYHSYVCSIRVYILKKKHAYTICNYLQIAGFLPVCLLHTLMQSMCYVRNPHPIPLLNRKWVDHLWDYSQASVYRLTFIHRIDAIDLYTFLALQNMYIHNKIHNLWLSNIETACMCLFRGHQHHHCKMCYCLVVFILHF